MTNIYIFWKETSDPPSPWVRLTRTNQYLRCSSSTANHWTDIGSTTHTHSSVSSFSCGNSASSALYHNVSGSAPMPTHSHSQPSSWTISSSNNTPPAYGLDIIYMDADYWETYEKRFPDGSIILSNGVLTDAGYISRFTSCDGYYIYNAIPGSTTGSTDTHYHTVSGTVASAPASAAYNRGAGSSLQYYSSHTHTISLNSTSTYVEPINIVTRLYEVLLETSKAISGSVAFFDGTPSSLWSILTSWNGANIKSGNSGPTVSGSDTHTQTISGNTGTNGSSNTVASNSDGDYSAAIAPHYHTVSGTLSSASHVPYSKYLTPAVLLSTLYHPIATSSPQIIGLSAW